MASPKFTLHLQTVESTTLVDEPRRADAKAGSIGAKRGGKVTGTVEAKFTTLVDEPRSLIAGGSVPLRARASRKKGEV